MARRWEDPRVGDISRSREGALLNMGTSPSTQLEISGGLVESPRVWKLNECDVCGNCIFVLCFCFGVATACKYNGIHGQGEQRMGIT